MVAIWLSYFLFDFLVSVLRPWFSLVLFGFIGFHLAFMGFVTSFGFHLAFLVSIWLSFLATFHVFTWLSLGFHFYLTLFVFIWLSMLAFLSWFSSGLIGFNSGLINRTYLKMQKLILPNTPFWQAEFSLEVGEFSVRRRHRRHHPSHPSPAASVRFSS
jgi:hypothetical protein